MPSSKLIYIYIYIYIIYSPVDKDSVIILYEISGGIKQVGSHPIKNYEHPDYLPQTPKLTGMDAFPHAYLSKIYTPHTLNPNKIYFTTERGLLMFIFRHDSEEATKTYHIFGPGKLYIYIYIFIYIYIYIKYRSREQSSRGLHNKEWRILVYPIRERKSTI